MSEAHPVVHVHGGSILLDHLRAAGVPGERLEWCDPVGSGPTPAGLSPDDWYRTRAAYLASTAPAGDVARIERRLREQDQALADAARAHADKGGDDGDAAELVIWAGPELFCQAILMRLLVLLPERARLSLVDPGDQPDSPGCGLGTMAPEALRAAFAARRPITAADRALASRAWAAFTAPSAGALVSLVQEVGADLPHLRPALSRHLADLPDGATGLSTTETHLLEELESGPLDVGALLEALGRREARPFLTDVLLEEMLRRLSSAAGPLVTVADRTRVSHLTRRGRDVLAGHDYWAAERWHGGVHILAQEQDDN
jgi:hypothetical protein